VGNYWNWGNFGDPDLDNEIILKIIRKAAFLDFNNIEIY
jgi:hypothetical protein